LDLKRASPEVLFFFAPTHLTDRDAKEWPRRHREKEEGKRVKGKSEASEFSYLFSLLPFSPLFFLCLSPCLRCVRGQSFASWPGVNPTRPRTAYIQQTNLARKATTFIPAGDGPTGRRKRKDASRSTPKPLLASLALLLALAWGGAALGIPAQDGGAQKSLYARLGGYDAIAAVVDDFVGRLVGDKQFERFFSGHSTDSKKRIRQHILDQLCAGAGGPCIYTGRTMKASHEGLRISDADWDASAKHLVASLDKFKVPEREKKELLDFIDTQKADIVEKK
jgi:hemoglobin